MSPNTRRGIFPRRLAGIRYAGRTVVFQDNGSTITGRAAVPIQFLGATCTSSTLTSGSHTISASYFGTASFNPSFSLITQVVN